MTDCRKPTARRPSDQSLPEDDIPRSFFANVLQSKLPRCQRFQELPSLDPRDDEILHETNTTTTPPSPLLTSPKDPGITITSNITDVNELASSKSEAADSVPRRYPWGGRLQTIPQEQQSEQAPPPLLYQWIVEAQNQMTSHRLSSLFNTLDVQWNEIVARCQTNPEEIVFRDHRGRTCVHLLCCCKIPPPVSVLHAILQAIDDSKTTWDSTQQLLTNRDAHGRTPLVLAIANTAPLSLIEALLEHCPQAATIQNHLGQYPLHLACSSATLRGSTSNAYEEEQEEEDYYQERLVRLLVKVYPQAADGESFSGQTPLHLAVTGGSTVRTSVVEQIVTANPNAVVNDSCGLNPLFVALRYKATTEVIQCLVRAYPDVITTRDRSGAFPFRRAVEERSVLDIQRLLAKSKDVVVDTDRTTHDTVLHLLLSSGGGSSNLLLARVEMMLKIAPDLAVQKNKLGESPLSIATRRWECLSPRREPNDSRILELFSVVCHLLRAAFYGQIYSAATRDERSMPVLHAAVALQAPPSVLTYIMENYASEQVSQMDCHGMYALHLAYFNRESSDQVFASRNDRSTDEEDRSRLNCVYLLLRKAPELVRVFTK